jgi:hypothetical protein
MKLHALTATAVLGFCLTACSTVTTLENGQSQQITVTTPPAKGALCVLTNTRGRWQVLTPGTANVLRSKDDLQISCKKPGWNEAVTVNKSTKVIESWDVYAVTIDASTGAGHQYTAEVVLPMTQVAPPPAAAVTAPTATPAAN